MKINEKIQDLILELNKINIDANFELKIKLNDDSSYNKTALIRYNHEVDGKVTDLIISHQEWHTDYELCETDIENLNKLYHQAKMYYKEMYASSRYNDKEIYQTKCRICGRIHDWEFHQIDDPENLGFLGFIKSHLSTPSLFVCETCKYQTIHDIVSYNQYNS